ncbi:MAG: hypothetical protein ACRD4R_09910 [Candidatus Acidiferrales bacterium]
MFRRLKRALVESYIGAIALGILLADVILNFVAIFVAPMESWTSQKTLRSIMLSSSALHSMASQALPLRDSLPPLGRFVLLLAIWCLLFFWLYAKPPKSTEDAEAAPSSDYSG